MRKTFMLGDLNSIGRGNVNQLNEAYSIIKNVNTGAVSPMDEHRLSWFANSEVKLKKMRLPACGHEVPEADAVCVREVTWLASSPPTIPRNHRESQTEVVCYLN